MFDPAKFGDDSFRIVFSSDWHAGHRRGLNTPEWQDSIKTPEGRIQRTLYKKAEAIRERHKKPDVLALVGDLLDGKGPKTGGTEQTTTDRLEQSKMVIDEINRWEAKKIYIVPGTPYHVGKEEDWEAVIAEKVGATFADQLFLDHEGIIFHMKHEVPRGGFTHTAFTPLGREYMDLMEWAYTEDWPDANIIIRAHTHRFGYCGGPGWLAMSLPGMCAFGSKFGARRCRGMVHFGAVEFRLKNGEYAWEEDIEKIRVITPPTFKI